MTSTSNFLLHPDAEVLDVGAAGIQELVSCIKRGLPVQAFYCADKPIRKGSGTNQWLDCQSSGSTGRPKTIRRSPNSWMTSFELVEDLFGVTRRDHYAVLGSLAHSLSLFAALEALHIGARLSILADFLPRSQVDAINSREVSVIYTTPTLLKRLVVSGNADGVSALKGVRRVLVGGGKLSASDRATAQDFLPNSKIYEFYGTSETSFITFATNDVPADSVGLPYPGVKIRIAKHTSCGSVGEVRVRSPYLAERYVGEDLNTLVEADGFVSTGEIGYLDDTGYLFLKGRSDRMVTVADVNVFPEAIEQAVKALVSVDTCVVIPLEDVQRGYRAVCFVKPSSECFEASELRSYCRELLGDAHVPKEVRVVSDMPMLPSGKPDLVTLQKLPCVRT